MKKLNLFFILLFISTFLFSYQNYKNTDDNELNDEDYFQQHKDISKSFQYNEYNYNEQYANDLNNLKPTFLNELRLPQSYQKKESKKIDFNELEKRINNYLSKYKYVRVGYYIKDINRNEKIESNADELFASASVVKVPLALALFKDIENGLISTYRYPLYEERHRARGSGYLKRLKSGQRFSIADLTYLMLARSDNTATNILADIVGIDRVTKFCWKNGWVNTNFVRDVMDLKARDKGIENWTTPREIGEMFEALYKGTLLNRTLSNILLAYMLNPPIADRIPRYLPASVDVVHKTGLIYDNTHDAGIMFLGDNQVIVISVFVDNIGANYKIGKHIIGKIAEMVYEESISEPRIVKATYNYPNKTKRKKSNYRYN
ncbi:MAG TPA: class A beta-lactamase-related serine hydrolase [bacterium]|nr:class A beta-lactamase-related serine hydrolase [bacterium]HOL47906.1 class A beta-lactamase-related serine hydrolase [bacterium]HPQ19221.1 class A beta-lactamase-related serine hydrolase [bacterium]